MADFINPPVRGETWTHYFAVEDYSNPGNFKANPTIAAGDWKLSLDDGALNNFATIPEVSPAGSIWIKFVFSATETDGKIIKIQGIDQTSPKEWSDFAVPIPTLTE